MSTKTWIVLDKNGVPDRTFEQSGTPASMQMTSLDAGTTYVARAGMESDGLQTLALQTVTFATLQAGAITVAYVSHERASSTDTVVYSYTSTYAPSAAVLASTVGGVTTNYQGVIDSTNHRITFTITDWTVGSTYSVVCRLDDIYGETATSAATSITVEETANWLYLQNTGSSAIDVVVRKLNNPTYIPSLEYKRDMSDNTWTAIDLRQQQSVTVSLGAGERMYLRGDNSAGFQRSTSEYVNIISSGQHIIGGNIMSLIWKNDFQTLDTVPAQSFYGLFSSDTGLTSVSGMDFSTITTALTYAFRYMFGSCTSLTGGMDVRNIKNVSNNILTETYVSCWQLSSAYYPNTTSLSISYNWLNGCAATGTIYVPTQTVHDAIINTTVVPSGWRVAVQS